LFFGGVGREVLDEEVASLLGVLVPDLVSLLLDLSVGLLQGFSHVQGLILNHLVVQLIDGFQGGLGTGFVISGGTVADKGVSAEIVGTNHQACDGTIMSEQGLQGLLSIAIREVLHVDVVIYLPYVSSVLRSIFGWDVAFAVLVFEDSLDGALGGLEAHESVPIGGVIGLQGDLQGLDITVLLEMVF